LFYFNDLCKLPESLLRFDITAIFGRNQLENALQAPREPIRCPVQEPAELDLGKPCSSSAIGCSATQHKKAEDQKHRPYFLGMAVKDLERLEIITDYCQAPYCYWLAQKRLQAVLEMEVWQSWQAND
jgi:hypothetical protein